MFQPAQVLSESGLHRRRVPSRDAPQADDRAVTLATPVHLVAERHKTVSLSGTVAIVRTFRCAGKVSILSDVRVTSGHVFESPRQQLNSNALGEDSHSQTFSFLFHHRKT